MPHNSKTFSIAQKMSPRIRPCHDHLDRHQQRDSQNSPPRSRGDFMDTFQSLGRWLSSYLFPKLARTWSNLRATGRFYTLQTFCGS
ncbi:hypothetical protein J6590_090797 [Homalodisca vitripennis]|nr:hypothetical protein J6590_090797 [Homalodisca vitripennis]